jgi:signal transduction histidine kinase
LHGRSEYPHLATNGEIPLSRASPAELDEEVQAAMGNPIVRALLEAFDGGLLVLDPHRQIVAANLRHLTSDPERLAPLVLGLRPGEALGCVHAREEPGGCGAALACRTCGALRTILGCQQTHGATEGECVVTAGTDGLSALELRLRATPVEIDGRTYTVLAVRDVSDEKRRAILEQVFFHDLLNSFSALSNWSQLLVRVQDDRNRPTAERLAALVRRVHAEIRGERALVLAERGELVPEPRSIRPAELLQELVEEFNAHPLARDRTLRVGGDADVWVQADPSLLLRVITNMVTNALEATPKGGTVTVGARANDDRCTFFVHNEGVIPEEVRPRIFQRSFSTKAKVGRGLGTYGMKLLGERYLGGRVEYVTGEEEGTEFRLRLPALASPEG